MGMAGCTNLTLFPLVLAIARILSSGIAIASGSYSYIASSTISADNLI